LNGNCIASEASPDPIIGHIVIETREAPLRGHKYVVSIAFDGKPDYSKIVEEFHAQGIHRDPMTEEVWDQVMNGLSCDRVVNTPSVFRVEEPCQSHPDDRFLKDFTLVDKEKYGKDHDWYRVRLYLLGDSKCEIDDLQQALEERLDELFGSVIGTGTFRLVNIKKINLFPEERKIISQKKIPIHLSKIENQIEKLAKESQIK
jgi:hypothetical protein